MSELETKMKLITQTEWEAILQKIRVLESENEFLKEDRNRYAEQVEVMVKREKVLELIRGKLLSVEKCLENAYDRADPVTVVELKANIKSYKKLKTQIEELKND